MSLRVLLILCSIIAVYATQAQETAIFKVKKPGPGIYIEPANDLLWVERENTICIIADEEIKIAKVELPGATIKKLKDNCYSITINGNTTPDANGNGIITLVKDDVESENKTGTATIRVLSVFEFLPDGTISLALKKTYKIPDTIIIPDRSVEMD